jgi:hypothetical protein
LLAAVFCPVIVVFWRYARLLAHAKGAVNSPNFRLSMDNFWTDVEHGDEAGGASQIMRLEDGNFVFLSVGVTTVRVFVTSGLERPDQFAEVASFETPHVEARQADPHVERRSENELILSRLRKAIGWPKSTQELSTALATIDSID